MSGGSACHCAERAKPADERAWFVVVYKCNYSAFSGGRWTPSSWSEIRCQECCAVWRTKAAYVGELEHE